MSNICGYCGVLGHIPISSAEELGIRSVCRISLGAGREFDEDEDATISGLSSYADQPRSSLWIMACAVDVQHQ